MGSAAPGAKLTPHPQIVLLANVGLTFQMGSTAPLISFSSSCRPPKVHGLPLRRTAQLGPCMQPLLQCWNQ